MSLWNGLEVFIQTVQDWVDESVPKAESSSGKGIKDTSIYIGVVTSVRPHHSHSRLTKDLEDNKNQSRHIPFLKDCYPNKTAFDTLPGQQHAFYSVWVRRFHINMEDTFS